MNKFLEELALFNETIYKRTPIREKPTTVFDYIDVYGVDWATPRFYAYSPTDLKYPGVYCLIDESNCDDPVFYVGQSMNIKKRLYSHFGYEGSPFYQMARRLDVEFEQSGSNDLWFPEKQRLFILSSDIRDERYYHRMVSESEYFSSANDCAKLLRYQ